MPLPATAEVIESLRKTAEGSGIRFEDTLLIVPAWFFFLEQSLLQDAAAASRARAAPPAVAASVSLPPPELLRYAGVCEGVYRGTAGELLAPCGGVFSARDVVWADLVDRPTRRAHAVLLDRAARTVVVAVRGTHALLDFLVDMCGTTVGLWGGRTAEEEKAARQPSEPLRVHKGFRLAAAAMAAPSALPWARLAEARVWVARGVEGGGAAASANDDLVEAPLFPAGAAGAGAPPAGLFALLQRLLDLSVTGALDAGGALPPPPAAAGGGGAGAAPQPYGGWRLVFTGHSLAAGVCAILAEFAAAQLAWPGLPARATVAAAGASAGAPPPPPPAVPCFAIGHCAPASCNGAFAALGSLTVGDAALLRDCAALAGDGGARVPDWWPPGGGGGGGRVAWSADLPRVTSAIVGEDLVPSLSVRSVRAFAALANSPAVAREAKLHVLKGVKNHIPTYDTARTFLRGIADFAPQLRERVNEYLPWGASTRGGGGGGGGGGEATPATPAAGAAAATPPPAAATAAPTALSQRVASGLQGLASGFALGVVSLAGGGARSVTAAGAAEGAAATAAAGAAGAAAAPPPIAAVGPPSSPPLPPLPPPPALVLAVRPPPLVEASLPEPRAGQVTSVVDAWAIRNFLAVDGPLGLAGVGELPGDDELMVPGEAYHFQRVGGGGGGGAAEAAHWVPRLVPAARWRKIVPHPLSLDDHLMSKALRVMAAAEALRLQSPPARDGRGWA
jgi:hypothetical protein